MSRFEVVIRRTIDLWDEVEAAIVEALGRQPSLDELVGISDALKEGLDEWEYNLRERLAKEGNRLNSSEPARETECGLNSIVEQCFRMPREAEHMYEQNTTTPRSVLKPKASDHLVSCPIQTQSPEHSELSVDPEPCESAQSNSPFPHGRAETSPPLSATEHASVLEGVQRTPESDAEHAETSLPLSDTEAGLDFTPPAADKDTLKWIHDRWPSHRWFALTVRFNMFTLHNPMSSLCHALFDSFVVYKLRKLIGVQYRQSALFMREYEIGMDGNGYCHHVHAVIGVEKGARIDRLTKNIQQALVGSGEGRIHGVRLDELKTLSDVDAAYSYMRKKNRHKTPFA
jgi:hypothetical protein